MVFFTTGTSCSHDISDNWGILVCMEIRDNNMTLIRMAETVWYNVGYLRIESPVLP